MISDYKCKVKINFNSGDVCIDVSDDKETFSYISGLGSSALAHFFGTLSEFYEGEITTDKLYCHGTGEFYIFNTDGTNLTIEHVDDYYDQYDVVVYNFNLRNYMEAVYISFTDYLNMLEQKRKLIPLKERDDLHPLNEVVINNFNRFSALIKS